MQSNLSRARFALLCRRVGIPLSLPERRAAFAAYDVLVELVAQVHEPTPDAEPATAFDPRDGW